jgi:DNA polymerase (family 10)
MPVHNSDIARIFNKVADLLEIDGANLFRVRSYRDAARTLGDLSKSTADMLAHDEGLSGLPSIGKDLAGKIEEVLKIGSHGLLCTLQIQFIPKKTDRTNYSTVFSLFRAIPPAE